MNDSELSTAVREAVAGVTSPTPVGQIVSRGRTVRARRRIPLAAGTLAVAGGAALAVTTMLPSGQPASRPAHAQLAAWTVSKQANGDIDVTVRQLKDPAGLQATLRADGVPATVSFSGTLRTAACHPVTAGLDELPAIARFHDDGITIDPSALPSGIGLFIYDRPGTGLPTPPAGARVSHLGSPLKHPSGGGQLAKGLDGPLAVGLVRTSQECTG